MIIRWRWNKNQKVLFVFISTFYEELWRLCSDTRNYWTHQEILLNLIRVWMYIIILTFNLRWQHLKKLLTTSTETSFLITYVYLKIIPRVDLENVLDSYKLHSHLQYAYCRQKNCCTWPIMLHDVMLSYFGLWVLLFKGKTKLYC